MLCVHVAIDDGMSVSIPVGYPLPENGGSAEMRQHMRLKLNVNICYSMSTLYSTITNICHYLAIQFNYVFNRSLLVGINPIHMHA